MFSNDLGGPQGIGNILPRPAVPGLIEDAKGLPVVAHATTGIRLRIFFSTTESDTNKAGQEGECFRSYGSTTADGILALLATGSAPEDARVIAAQKWLTSHHRDMEVPGLIGAAYQRWPRGLAF
jgi:hypothetical protein